MSGDKVGDIASRPPHQLQRPAHRLRIYAHRGGTSRQSHIHASATIACQHHAEGNCAGRSCSPRGSPFASWAVKCFYGGRRLFEDRTTPTCRVLSVSPKLIGHWLRKPFPAFGSTHRAPVAACDTHCIAGRARRWVPTRRTTRPTSSKAAATLASPRMWPARNRVRRSTDARRK